MKYLLLSLAVLLGGCIDYDRGPRFTYGDKVTVDEGALGRKHSFYNCEKEGRVTSYYQADNTYEVRFKCNNSKPYNDIRHGWYLPTEITKIEDEK